MADQADHNPHPGFGKYFHQAEQNAEQDQFLQQCSHTKHKWFFCLFNKAQVNSGVDGHDGSNEKGEHEKNDDLVRHE